MSFSGMLPVYKPSGLTSKDVSRKLTRILGKVKLGHVGTLDPMAEGVLPVLFGKATRLQDYLHVSSKIYECDVLLGSSTDTMDKEGEVTEEAPWNHVTEKMVLEALKKFEGPQIQVPPLYSAVKYKGKALHKYARSQKEDEVPLEDLKREVFIDEIKLLRFDSQSFTFSAKVSKGTYIRVLAHDLAKELGTLGHITRLVRQESSGLTLGETTSLEEILKSLTEGASLSDFLIPLSKMPIALERLHFKSERLVMNLQQGQTFFLSEIESMINLPSSLRERLTSCEGMEVLLENRDHLVFGIASLSKTSRSRLGEKISQKASDGFILKMKKGLL